MIIGDGREKIKILLDLNEEMLRTMKNMFPDRVLHKKGVQRIKETKTEGKYAKKVHFWQNGQMKWS